MKKLMAVIMITMMVLAMAGCGKKYTCDMCGASVREAYYNIFDTDVYYCKDCAKDYYAPLPYKNYKVD